MQFDRYLLAQLIRTTLSVAVTLIGIVWLFQTIRILEIVELGRTYHGLFVMSLTVIPLWLTIALPISAFVAGHGFSNAHLLIANFSSCKPAAEVHFNLRAHLLR